MMMEEAGTSAMLVKFVIIAHDATSKNTIFSHCHKKIKSQKTLLSFITCIN